MSDEQMLTEGERPFSGIFLPVGELLLISEDLSSRLGEFLGKSYREIRAAAGITGRAGTAAPPLVMTDDGFAIISMIGLVTRYDGWCSSLFGGVSTQSVMDQFQAAFDDPSCYGVLFRPDSGGGDAAAIHDLSDMIFQSRDTKPVVAYVDNLAASAAYWPASGANKVVVAPPAFVGSIGVVTTVMRKMRDGKDDGTFEIVSSKSPNKRPDVNTDAGRAQIQARVDDLADVFINSVAKHRGVDASKVLSDFGQGGVLIGAKAVAAGMADQVGDSNDAFNALRELAERSTNDQNRFGRSPATFQFSSGGGSQAEGNDMAEKPGETPAIVITTAEQLRTAHPTLVTQVEILSRAEGAEGERNRIQAIDAIDTPTNRAIAGNLITVAKWDGKTSHESLAYQIMVQGTKKNTETAAARKEDAAGVPDVQDAPQSGAGDQTSQLAIGTSIALMINERRGAPKK